jgi:hypothetical protein
MDNLNDIPDEAAQAAAKWWAEALRDPRFDNGDGNGLAGVMAMMAARAAPPITDDQIERFKETLIKAMQSPGFYGRLAVDYDPDATLAAAAQSAGISARKTAFPWKTRMRITAHEVTVAAGYGAPYQVVWTAGAASPQ